MILAIGYASIRLVWAVSKEVAARRTAPQLEEGEGVEAEKCSLCGKDKSPVPNKTSKKGLTVFICSEPVGRAKSPCDGPAYDLACKNA